MSKKKLLAINLNEFNLKFLKYGANKYDFPYIKRLVGLKKISTYSHDKTQDKDLDPWVQSICINSGKRSKNHGVYNLGEKIPKNLEQIWDYLSRKKKYSAVWGPMNTRFKNNKYIKIFMPDPWNNQTNVKPLELKDIYSLAKVYAQDYSDVNLLKLFPNFFKFFIYIIKKKIFFRLLCSLPSYMNIIFKNGLKNYFLFFLFDIISLLTFQKLTKKIKIDFSLIFLNSLAHFQHNNWDNKKAEKDYFFFTEEILKIVFNIYKNYDSIIIYNGFSQKRIVCEYLLKPKNPKVFFKNNYINFKTLHSNMTNGALITFKNHKLLLKELKKINDMNIFGFKLFNTEIINSQQIFCRCQVRSKNDFNIFNLSISKIKKSFFYEKPQRKINKNINSDIDEFIKNFAFIKTTSHHISHGDLFFQNINIKKNKIENIEINNLIKNFFFKNKILQ